MTDYRQFKTPFYEIEISAPGTAAFQRRVKLPHQILRLLEKVEITEVMGDTPTEVTTAKLYFTEGSREPASPNSSLGTEGLYKVPNQGDSADLSISGTLTNRIGTVTDLRFSGSSGITFLSENEQRTGVTDATAQLNVEEEVVTRTNPAETRAPLFLFEERNIVKITWGYLEDKQSRRSIALEIQAADISYPESGQVKTTIICTSPRMSLDQISTNKGKRFGVRRKLEGAGSLVTIHEDIATPELIKEICDKSGMDCIVSDSLPAPSLDKHHVKAWIAGESFDEFMKRLAKEHNAKYTVEINPKTGKDTLVFIEKREFESTLISAPKNYFTYKAPNSILKSVKVTAKFHTPAGSNKAVMNKEGKQQSYATDSGSEVVQLFGSQKEVNSNPKGTNSNKTAKQISESIANGGTSSKVLLDVEQEPKSLEERAKIDTNNDKRGTITAEFMTLGYTKLHPGVIKISNIGVRYSGVYKIISVTHSIDRTGYVCRANATTEALSAGGTQIPEADKKSDEAPEKTEVQLFGGTARTQYDKMKGIK